MAEIFGTALGITDVTFRVVAYLQDVRRCMGTVTEDLEGLIQEVELLKATHEQVQEEISRGHVNPSLFPGASALRSETVNVLKSATRVVEKLEQSVVEIYGPEPTSASKIRLFRQARRKMTYDGRVVGFRDQIQTHNACLQMWLNAIQSVVNRHSVQTVLAAIGDVQSRLSNIEDREMALPMSSVGHDFNMASLAALTTVGISAAAVERSCRDSDANKHFDIPERISPFYTGRNDEAERLAVWLVSSSGSAESQRLQKRFVVYGVSGSGKTQFCCKFAEDHRESFWGIFWIDGRSHERLKQSLLDNVAAAADIVSENYKAALNWLSNLERRWLLIIDNADDPDIALDDYLPKGNRGHILITTQNPEHAIYGNVGTGFFNFYGLSHVEAQRLFLIASGQAQPWDAIVSGIANQITEVLGYLALAVTHAAAVIRTQFLKLHEYLEVYEMQRRKRHPQSQKMHLSQAEDSSITSSAEAALDLVLQAVCRPETEEAKDAEQLINMMAFLHPDHIRFEFFRRCVLNAALEEEQDVRDKANVRTDTWSSNGLLQTPSRRFHALLMELAMRFRTKQSVSILPDALRSGRREGEFDRARLRGALRRLCQHSLINHNDETDTYSMHPLVQRWARERVGLGLGGQFVWAEAATRFLSSCVLLPPLGNTIDDELLRRDLLRHVNQARSLQDALNSRPRNRSLRRARGISRLAEYFSLFSMRVEVQSPTQILTKAKFAFVYVHNGKFEEAKSLLEQILRVLTEKLGMESSRTRKVAMFLAGTYLQLRQPDCAVKIQEDVLDACKTYLGCEHPDYFTALHRLGESRFYQGRVAEASRLQRQAFLGLEKVLSPDNEALLDVLQALGLTLSLFRTDDAIEEAQSLQERAYAGFERTYGADHSKTLKACEGLCATISLTHNREQLICAEHMMQDVWEKREILVGTQHPETLIAMLTLARVKAALEDFDGAQRLFDQGLAIAEKLFELDYPPLLWAKYIMGKMWVQQYRWKEARDLLKDITDRQKSLLQGLGDSHPDRLGPLVELAKAYQELGEYEECDRVVNETLSALEEISVSGDHPVAMKLRADSTRWQEMRRGTALQGEQTAAAGKLP